MRWKRPGVVNASCEFNVETLMPTYKLSIGVPGKSNAFLISAKLGIPQEIIDAARNHMSNDDKRLDSVLSQLDDLKAQLKEHRPRPSRPSTMQSMRWKVPRKSGMTSSKRVRRSWRTPAVRPMI